MKKKLIIAFIIFSSLGAGIFYILTKGNIGEKYNTVEVTKGTVEKYVEEVGRISSSSIIRYYGNGAGKVEEMTLKLGDYVTKGQLLIKYEDNSELEIKKVEKQIEALRATYREVLSSTDVGSVNNARIEISSLRSDLEWAVKNKAQTEELYNAGAIPLIELEQETRAIEALQRRLEQAQNTYNQLVKGVSANTRKRYEAEIDVMLLTLEMYKKNREDLLIYAERDGIVTEVNTFAGDIPSPGTVIIELQDPSEKVVLVDFMVEEARQIRPDMDVEINDPALGIVIENLKVSKVHPKAFITLSELGVEENRQTVEISLPASSEDLAYGLEVNTRVRVETPRDALLVPLSAVYQKDSKNYVTVLEDKKPVEREITTGAEVQNKLEVKEGLSEGDLVILNYEED
ncbi:efflux RND transporter periplasmic adaptor subunit [Acidaminobacter hydrogenoformans]|uniref:Multidrug efflux pump subunit AcrA (Membrane-fusion protein) n=1 Tax=Acidaminobacter hydrogenoformans DSM 2784 TaxID=1120920 RepID=A0A1G5S599_9FIRM|nr:efflux RND transporter periplasmic adaptor subunit [Acidaminobacter hydrogenoformans]SCZ80931.1 Multidrug efflux pump subunit AcrA (membrane-fusion protein) [Acidaminobacter hydrogenoformans DSM 2784]